ncbi:NUDIX hydrolase [Patescibacteria group bacterium]|nr:NUDIX hydrolase [Patescibacteria group bacterium]
MLLQVGVKALLKNSQGKYLLLHRSAEKYPEVTNPWDIPGGRIEPGSSLFENLKREIREETGLDLLKEPRLIAAQDILKSDKHVVRLTFTGEIEGAPKLEDEHDDFKWCDRSELDSMEGLDSYLKQALKFL